MRAFTTHTVAVALDLDAKWIDNLLAQNKIEGCIRVRQGVGRRLSLRGVLHVALIADLTHYLRIPVRAACEVAAELLGPGTGKAHIGPPGGPAQFALTPALVLSLDVEALERSVARLLAHAVETAPRPRRGRPPANPSPRDLL